MIEYKKLCFIRTLKFTHCYTASEYTVLLICILSVLQINFLKIYKLIDVVYWNSEIVS